LEKDFAGLSPQAVAELLGSIIRSGRKASNIVEDLLILAGVRDQEIKASPIKMGDIVREAQHRLIDMIGSTQAKISEPSEWPVVLGYAPWVEEVWVNYLSNGLKYGGQPPDLELGATLQGNHTVRFWVKDNGPGLRPEEQAKLFMPFQRLEKVRIEGYGLGLSIVRRIVEKLGGEVGVESPGVPGRGSVFFFTLPSA
jgi:signal transduction histidine kinase